MPPFEAFPPFNPGLVSPTIMRLPPGLFGTSVIGNGTVDSFQSAQIPPPPADPYAPPPPQPGGLIPPTLPGETLPGGIPALPLIDTSGSIPVPTLPQIGGTGGVVGAGNRMALYNRYRLQFQEGGFYRAQIPDNANPGRHVTDNDHKYYWLPDGSLLRTNNDGTGGQIISMNAAGTEQLPSRAVNNANDGAMVNWGRTLASQGGLIPVNNGSSYARGGNADSGEFILVPSTNGTVYRLEGPNGAAQGFSWNGTTHVNANPSANDINTARAFRAMNLRPRRHGEVIAGGNGVDNITYRPGQWVAIPSGNQPPQGVFEFSGMSSGNVDLRLINTNTLDGANLRPAPANNTNEGMSVPRVISCEYNPTTGAITYFARVWTGTGSDHSWYRMQELNGNYYIRRGTNLMVLQNVSGTWRWVNHTGARPEGINI